jgi:hypothetical protein
MADRLAGERATQEQQKVTGKLNREQLEQALKRSLAAGPPALAQQVRYILALSQMTAAVPTMTSQPETPSTIAGARLGALAELAPTLDENQRARLFNDIQQIDDDDIRLHLTLKLTPHLKDDLYAAMMPDLWRQACALNNAVFRSQILFRLAPWNTEHRHQPGEGSDCHYHRLIDGGLEARARPGALALQLLNRKRSRCHHHHQGEQHRTTACAPIRSTRWPTSSRRRSKCCRRARSDCHPAGTGASAAALTRNARPRCSGIRTKSENIEQIKTKRNAPTPSSPSRRTWGRHREHAYPALLNGRWRLPLLTRRSAAGRWWSRAIPGADLQGEALAAVVV